MYKLTIDTSRVWKMLSVGYGKRATHRGAVSFISKRLRELDHPFFPISQNCNENESILWINYTSIELFKKKSKMKLFSGCR